MGVVRRDSGGRAAVISAMISASRAEKRTETDRQAGIKAKKRKRRLLIFALASPVHQLA